jgi:hypothetical protein
MPSKIDATTKLSTKYCLVEIRADNCLMTDPMNYFELLQFVRIKYQDQPLKYFNQGRHLHIIDMVTHEIRPLSLRIEI